MIYVYHVAGNGVVVQAQLPVNQRPVISYIGTQINQRNAAAQSYRGGRQNFAGRKSGGGLAGQLYHYGWLRFNNQR